MSSFGNTISRFNDWHNMTRAQRLSGPEEIVNEARSRTYLLSELLTRDVGQLVQNGKFIEDQLMLIDPVNMAYNYTPGQDRDSQRIETKVNFNVPFRFREVPYPYTQEELQHNGDAGSRAEFVKFKDFRFGMKQYLYTAMLNSSELALFGRPSQTLMEAGSVSTTTAATPGTEYSIPSFVCEGTEGPNGGGKPPTAVWAGSNIQGIDYTTYSLYRNAVATYDKTAHDDEDNGIFAAMDRMATYITFNRVPGYDQYMQEASFRKLKICTNRNGYIIYQKLLRGANDQLRGGPQDAAYGDPTYHGVPVRYYDSLTNNLLDQAFGTTTSPGAYSGTVYPDGSPRYYFLNLDFLKPIFGMPNLFDLSDPVNGAARQPDAWTVFLRAKWNLVCLSRQRQGVIHPNA